MLKNKYQRMNRQEKKELYKDYIKTKDGKSYFNRLHRILYMGLILFLYTIYLVIDTILNNNSLLYSIFIGLVLLASLIFICSYYRLKITTLNNYALNKNKKNF